MNSSLSAALAPAFSSLQRFTLGGSDWAWPMGPAIGSKQNTAVVLAGLNEQIIKFIQIALKTALCF